MLVRGDEAGEVRHVDHQLRADRVGDLAEGGEVEVARVGRAAGDDHLRPVLVGEPRDLVHVDEVVLAAHVVGDDLVELPETFSFIPWLRCPPWSSAIPRIVSPGSSIAM